MEAVRPRPFEAVDSTGQPAPRVAPLDIAGFAASLNGSVVRPDDDAYGDARQVHNAAFDRHPTLIVRAADASDVARTVTFAAETGLELAVRSGGHSMAGYGTTEGGIVLDLSSMKGLFIDLDRRLAWAQPGLTTGEVMNAAAVHGLTVPFGDATSVGIGGLTTGGGIGFLTRKHGMTIDNLVAAEIVTADGRLLTVDERHHPDLFWAIRGGGGNVGVLTRFVYRLLPVDMVVGGGLALPATPAVLAGLVREARNAPDELTMIAYVMHAPPAPFIPADRVGELAIMVLGVYDGEPEGGQAAWAPFRALAEPIADLVGPMPYSAIYQFTADAAARGSSTTRSWFSDDLDEADAAMIFDFMGGATTPFAMTQIRILGGAMSRVANDATAFSQRDATVMVAAMAMFEGDAAPHVAWTTAFFEAFRPKATGVYSNFLAAEGDARVREAYPHGAYERLAEIKRRYDPSNLFRLNQNVRPA